MNNGYEQVFSEYEVKETSIKFPNDTTSKRIGCVGSIEETLDSKVITKKCEGVSKTVRVKGTGTGELKISLHMKYELYAKAYGMKFDKLKDGVYAYGEESVHNKFSLAAKVLDEDGNCKLKAYPNLLLKSGISRKIENGTEEIAEIEMTVSVNPDENGFGMYEAIVSELGEDKATIENSWLTSFTPSLALKSEETI